MKTLKELQAENPPRGSCDSLGITLKGAPAEVNRARRIMDDYFQHFTATVTCDQGIEEIEACPCIRCGRPQSGLLGAFTWDICHGEGFCGNCKWPSRAVHRILENDGDDEPFATLSNYILQYHPSVVSEDTAQLDKEEEVLCAGS